MIGIGVRAAAISASAWRIDAVAVSSVLIGKMTIAKPRSFEPLVRDRGRLAAFGPVEQQGDVGELGRDGLDLGLARRGLDEEHVGARVLVATRARSIAAGRPSTARGVGPGDDHEVGRLPGRDRGADLREHLVGRDDLLALHVPAPLGRHLVLDVQRRHAGLLVLLHGPHDVDRVAEAGVGVGDDGQRAGPCDAAGVVDHLRHRHEPDVGTAEHRRGRSEPRHVGRVEPRLLDEAGAERVVHTRCEHGIARVEQLPQSSGSVGRRADVVRHPSSGPRGRAHGNAAPGAARLRPCPAGRR